MLQVGEQFAEPAFPDVGPQRAMPSGGLVAMGNVRAFARDIGAGWGATASTDHLIVKGVLGHYFNWGRPEFRKKNPAAE